MLHEVPIEKCLLVAVCFLSIRPYMCYAEYPPGVIPRESEVQDRFFSGQVPPGDLSEVRLVRLSDSYENLPSDWNAVGKAEQIVITEQSTIAKTIDLLKHRATPANTLPEHKDSPCPALGAFVGHLRNPQSDWVVVFFYAYDDHLTLRSPSGMSADDEGLWRYVKEKYPKLLRPTRGAQLTAKAKTQGTNVKRIFYRDGSLRTEIPIVHGQFNGIGKNYFKNGHVSLTLPYKDGKLNGIAKSYAENGKLLGETAYAAGERHGADCVYDENGKPLGTNWWWHGKSVSEEEFKRLKAGDVR